MAQFSFTCPLSDCGHIMTVEADSETEAVEKLSQIAQKHLEVAHPEVRKTGKEVHKDISSLMVTM